MSHRFQSFAGERTQNFIKWCVVVFSDSLADDPLSAKHPRHIDGHDYFYALSELLESARESIFIFVRTTRLAYHCHRCDLGSRTGG
jgi:phospholipase D1/2